MMYRGWKIFLVILLFCTKIAAENISVIGIGRLGLCSALVFERAGHNVMGVDINQNYIEALNNKTFHSSEPLVDKYLQKSKNFKATTSLDEALQFSEIVFIVVATPSTPSREAYDHTHLSKLLTEINKRKVVNKHIVICSTIFPGYIRDVGSFLLSDCENTTLSYNPEFIAQGTIISNFENPDVVLIGQGSKEAGDVLETIYKKTCKNNPRIARMSNASAEIAKLALNCFVTTKIAYANMIGDLADSTPGADKNDIIEMLGADKRIGSKCLMPGYGFGGPCFPRDNRALGSYAQQLDINPLIPKATDESNKIHTKFMEQQLLKCGYKEYVFEDVCYKPHCAVPIIEESQKLEIAASLALKGNKVTIKDSAIVLQEVKQKYGNIFKYQKVNNYE